VTVVPGPAALAAKAARTEKFVAAPNSGAALVAVGVGTMVGVCVWVAVGVSVGGAGVSVGGAGVEVNLQPQRGSGKRHPAIGKGQGRPPPLFRA